MSANMEVNDAGLHQRMKEFSYYLTTEVENNFVFLAALLDNSKLPKKPNSDAVTALSTLATPIPMIGKELSQALKEGETFILNKMDQKDSRRVADLVYFFDDNKSEVRKMLIQASIEVFYSFEDQFRRVTCDGGPRRAMHKLGKDAAHRIFTFLLHKKQDESVTKEDFSKGVVFGHSLRTKIGVEKGRSVTNGKKEWKTVNIFTKVGLFSEDSNEFFAKSQCDWKTYGFRRKFSWELLSEIRRTWPKTDPVDLRYSFNKDDLNLEEMYLSFRDYIMTKDHQERAQLDRETKHQEAQDDRQAKHDEIIQTFLENNSQVLDSLRRNYEEIKLIRSDNEDLVEMLKKQEEIQKRFDEKLTEIRSGISETTEKIEETNKGVMEAIDVIRSEDKATQSTQVASGLNQYVEERYLWTVDFVHRNDVVKKIVTDIGKGFNIRF